MRPAMAERTTDCLHCQRVRAACPRGGAREAQQLNGVGAPRQRDGRHVPREPASARREPAHVARAPRRGAQATREGDGRAARHSTRTRQCSIGQLQQQRRTRGRTSSDTSMRCVDFGNL